MFEPGDGGTQGIAALACLVAIIAKKGAFVKPSGEIGRIRAKLGEIDPELITLYGCHFLDGQPETGYTVLKGIAP